MSDRQRQFEDQPYVHFLTFSVYRRRRLVDRAARLDPRGLSRTDASCRPRLQKQPGPPCAMFARLGGWVLYPKPSSQIDAKLSWVLSTKRQPPLSLFAFHSEPVSICLS